MQFGWPETLSKLSDDQLELLIESYNSDPRWVSRGQPRIEEPNAVEKCRVVIELNTKEAPKACENFRCLCTGEKGKGKSSGKDLHYKGCRMHRYVLEKNVANIELL